MARTYEARRLMDLSTFGVSPRTRTRLRQRAYNITPTEVDDILRINGEEGNRKRMAEVAYYIDQYSWARELYDQERADSGNGKAYNPAGSESAATYFALQAWVESKEVGLVWVPLSDADKWERDSPKAYGVAA